MFRLLHYLSCVVSLHFSSFVLCIALFLLGYQIMKSIFKIFNSKIRGKSVVIKTMR